jgi:hypothetical protein
MKLRNLLVAAASIALIALGSGAAQLGLLQLKPGW